MVDALILLVVTTTVVGFSAGGTERTSPFETVICNVVRDGW